MTTPQTDYALVMCVIVVPPIVVFTPSTGKAQVCVRYRCCQQHKYVCVCTPALQMWYAKIESAVEAPECPNSK